MIDDDADFGPPCVSVYDMFLRNDRQVGFWLRMPHWHNRVCRVVSVEDEGRSCATGAPPVVRADFYDARTGLVVTPGSVLKRPCCSSGERWCDYRRVDPPPWWSDPAAAVAPERRKPGQRPARLAGPSAGTDPGLVHVRPTPKGEGT